MENAGKADCFVWQSINAYLYILFPRELAPNRIDRRCILLEIYLKD